MQRFAGRGGSCRVPPTVKIRATVWMTLWMTVACSSDTDSSTSDATSAGDVSAPDSGVAATSDGEADEAAGDTNGDAGSNGADACAIGPSPQVQIGHGDGSFVPFGMEPAEIVYGVQGGTHIVVGLQASGLDSTDLAEARLTAFADGEQVGGSVPYAELRCLADGSAQQALGLLLLWDATPDMLHMQTVTIELELTDAVGTVVSASADTLIIDPTQR